MKSRKAIWQIKVTLCDIQPEIWRRLLVPASARLDWLHAVLQVAMGWTNSHLHVFTVDGQDYSNTDHHYNEFVGEPVILEEAGYKLSDLLSGEGSLLEYTYDFGDNWQHHVVVEKILPPESSDSRSALCIDGRRACPPEDCGSSFGYEELLSILKNRRHPEYRAMKEWVSAKFDPEVFDPDRTNFWLKKLPWPHVTTGRLRSVLMGRHGAV